MTQMNLRKAFGAAALIGASLVTANVMAQPYYPGYGMGPGMMGGYGMGPGMMGGYGMGPGMGGGYGMGPGMMAPGMMPYGMVPGMMAPGMMPYGMGPGMMGGSGMDPGMMMGPGMMGRSMGSGMMGGGVAAQLNLTEEQRGQITKIQNELRQKHSEVMGKMQAEMLQMREMFASNNSDEAALSTIYKKMSDLRQEMFDQLLSTQKQVNAVLTDEQRDLLKQN